MIVVDFLFADNALRGEDVYSTTLHCTVIYIKVQTYGCFDMELSWLQSNVDCYKLMHIQYVEKFILIETMYITKIYTPKDVDCTRMSRLLSSEFYDDEI